MTQSQPDASTPIPASAILQELHEKAPADHFTLGWLMGSLPKQSFGLIILLLAIVATAPGICLIAGLMLLIPAFRNDRRPPAPVFPRWIAARPLPTRHLGTLVQHAITTLRYLEKTIYPRWPTPPEATKRVVGIAVLLLDARLILAPVPLSNIFPAVVIAMIALAYLEEDGLVLTIGLLVGFVRPGARPGGGLGNGPRRKMD